MLQIPSLISLSLGGSISQDNKELFGLANSDENYLQDIELILCISLEPISRNFLYDLDSLPYFPGKDGGALSFVSLNGVNHRVRRNPRLGPPDGLRSNGASLVVPAMSGHHFLVHSKSELRLLRLRVE